MYSNYTKIFLQFAIQMDSLPSLYILGTNTTQRHHVQFIHTTILFDFLLKWNNIKIHFFFFSFHFVLRQFTWNVSSQGLNGSMRKMIFWLDFILLHLLICLSLHVCLLLLFKQQNVIIKTLILNLIHSRHCLGIVFVLWLEYQANIWWQGAKYVVMS